MASGINLASGTAQRQLGLKLDPFKAYNFLLEVEGLVVGGFTSIDGLESHTEVKTVRQGGVNDSEVKLPGQVVYSDLTLKAGLTALDPLWLWYQATLNGVVARKNGTIYLLNDAGVPLVWWDFFNAWPSQWQGPAFDASQTLVASQTFTLVHEGLRKSFSSMAAAAAGGGF